jgi:hypothetical protein
VKVHETASRSDSHGADSAQERTILAVSRVLTSRQARRCALSVLRYDRQRRDRPDASARRSLVTGGAICCGGGWGGSGDHGLWRQGVDSAGFNDKRGLKQWCVPWWSAVRRPHPDRDRGLERERGLKQWCTSRIWIAVRRVWHSAVRRPFLNEIEDSSATDGPNEVAADTADASATTVPTDSSTAADVPTSDGGVADAMGEQ